MGLKNLAKKLDPTFSVVGDNEVAIPFMSSLNIGRVLHYWHRVHDFWQDIESDATAKHQLFKSEAEGPDRIVHLNMPASLERVTADPLDRRHTKLPQPATTGFIHFFVGKGTSKVQDPVDHST
jgi:hypothetical protein